MASSESAPTWASSGIDLAGARVGGRVLFATDEWFAKADNLLKPGAPQFDPEAFCEQGKVMDGWESRRRRLPGHDFAIIRLGLPGQIHGIEVDTAWFTGNQAPLVSVQVAELAKDPELPGLEARLCAGCGLRGTAWSPENVELAEAALIAGGVVWHELLPRSPLRPGLPGQSVHYFAAPDHSKVKRATHLRLNYFPDGGVARLRVWGHVARAFGSTEIGEGAEMPLDLASVHNGGRGLACSNRHYGVPRNLLQDGRGVNMGDGWETARHPARPAIVTLDPATGFSKTELMDWCVVKLGAVAAFVESVVIDTAHFRGNFPESAMLEVCNAPDTEDERFAPGGDEASSVQWRTLLPRVRLGPDQEHCFTVADGALEKCDLVTHVRLSIYPDGGIMRLRVFAKAAAMF